LRKGCEWGDQDRRRKTPRQAHESILGGWRSSTAPRHKNGGGLGHRSVAAHRLLSHVVLLLVPRRVAVARQSEYSEIASSPDGLARGATQADIDPPPKLGA